MKEENKKNLIDIADAFPVVVNRELFNRVQSKMNSSKYGVQKPKTTKLMRNLFNGISTCGVCGKILVVCMNGHGTLFYSCLGRRFEKTCTNVGINYTKFETSILKNIKELNWSSIYTGESDQTEKLDNCRLKIVDAERKISEFNKELIGLDDDDLELLIIRKIKKNKEALSEFVTELNGLMANVDSYTDFNPDLELVHDQENTKLRQDTNIALRKVIKQIAIIREGNLVQCWIKYYTDTLSHLFLYDIKKKDVISKTHITDECIFHFNSGSIDIRTGKITISGTEQLTEEDKIAFDLWLQMIEAATDRVETHLQNGIPL
ncbi:hypothetical protein D3C85_1144460 [compost metagenome]